MARYRDAIEWIALNDEEEFDRDDQIEVVAEQISVALVADLWRYPILTVARDVVRFRQRQGAKL